MGAILVRDLPNGPYRDVLLLAQARAKRDLVDLRMDGASALVIGVASLMAEAIGTPVYVNGEPRILVGEYASHEDLVILSGMGPGTYGVSCSNDLGREVILPGAKCRVIPDCRFNVSKNDPTMVGAPAHYEPS